MQLDSKLLTPAEAAVVADVSVRNVNRAIDEHILPERFVELKGGRWLRTDACAYLRFYFHSAKRLTADERVRVIRILATPAKRAGPRDLVVGDGFITVNFDRYVAETTARHEALVRARERVVEDPGVLGGTPTLRGTRIPVHDVAAAVAAGQPVDRIKLAYSGLDDESIELATLYAEAHPPRGRPRRPVALEPRLKLVTERKIPRHARG
jgi:uncharacterized protein (DUF433 family)